MSTKKIKLPKRILGLDTAESTGWAFYAGGKKVFHGVESFKPPSGSSPGVKHFLFYGWLKRICGEDEVDFVAYERPFIRGGKTSTALKGYETIIHMVCAELGIEHLSVAGLTIKKEACGHAGSKAKPTTKAMVLGAARKRFGKRVKSEDTADALWCLVVACKKVGLEMLK